MHQARESFVLIKISAIAHGSWSAFPVRSGDLLLSDYLTISPAFDMGM